MRNKIRIVRCRNLEYRVCSGTEREISREDEEGRKKEGRKKEKRREEEENISSQEERQRNERGW